MTQIVTTDMYLVIVIVMAVVLAFAFVVICIGLLPTRDTHEEGIIVAETVDVIMAQEVVTTRENN